MKGSISRNFVEDMFTMGAGESFTRVFGESRTDADEYGAIHGANFNYNPA